MAVKSLNEVLQSVETFKKDMEDLGAFIHVNFKKTEADTGPKVRVLLCLLVSEELEEDLEGDPSVR